MKTLSHQCPECGGRSLFTTTANSGGGHGAVLLPGLNGFFQPARFRVVVCSDCGLTRLYAEPRALEKLPRARQWGRI
jgi:predicted nucleic-acid-binding Zn-ribbon protein